MFSAESIGIVVGLALALGIFSFKTAVGEYYFFAVTASGVRRGVFLAVTWGAYLALFLAAFQLLEHFDLFRLAGESVAFLELGTLLHLLLCTGLLIWGTRLLSRRDDCGCDHGPGHGPEHGGIDSKGWLLLAVPCPVCASAVFLVCAFARMLFPESAGVLRILIPAFFLLSNLVFLLALCGIAKFFSVRPLFLTGRTMIFIALYFLLILLIAPQFQDVEKLYAVASASNDSAGISAGVIGVIALFGSLLGAGFFIEYFLRKGR